MIKHPVGNFKIKLIKKTSKIISDLILFFLSFFLKINKNHSEIIISNSFYAPWKEDKNFIKIYKLIKDYTLLDKRRLYTLWYLSLQVKNINGCVYDVGCLKGGAGFLLSINNQNNFTYLFDTFSGYVDKEKFYKKNTFEFNDINYVRKNIKKLKLKKIKVVKGIFPNIINKSILSKRIKLCHLDVNTYKSTLKSFNYIKKRIVKGGFIVFDDYGMYGADGIKKLIKKIVKNSNNKFHFIYNFQGQCIVIKK